MPVNHKYTPNIISGPEIENWHTVEISVLPRFNKQLNEHLDWLNLNISTTDWRLPGTLQYNNLWVYKFRHREDAVRFALVWG